MVKTITWKKLVDMSPADRAEDFLVRVRELSSELIRDGAVQVPLLELYHALYTGVPAKTQQRDILTRALKDNNVVSSTGQGRYATWTVNFPEAQTSPGDDVLPEGKAGDGTMPDDKDKKLPADEAEESDLSPVHVERRLAEIDLSVQTRKVKILTFAEHMLEVARAEGLDRGEFDEAVNWVHKSL
jgi:hypothetical protein